MTDTGETLQVVQVRLTADQIATARRLGNGNASEGVRRALESMGGSWADCTETPGKAG